MSQVVHTVPWHPSGRHIPGWLLHLAREVAAIAVQYDGWLPKLSVVAESINLRGFAIDGEPYTVDEDLVLGAANLLLLFGLIAPGAVA